MNYLKFFLRKSYHRPSAKIESIITLFKKITFSDATDLFSERSALLKRPLKILEFYNGIGRIILYIKCFTSILFTNNFPSSESISLKDSHAEKIYKNNFQESINPFKAFHQLDDQKSFTNKNIILNNYKKHYETYKNINGDSEWWIKCRKEFKELFIKNNGEINIESLENFRSSSDASAAILTDSSRLLNKKMPRKLRKIMSLRHIMQFHELAERIDKNILLVNSESSFGNPPILRYRNIYLTQRSLRFSYYLSSLVDKIPTLKSPQKNLVVDIGGAYGGLVRALKHFCPNNTYIICELPETIMLAEYFLRSCFSKELFLHLYDPKEINNYSSSDLKKYNFIFMTPDVFYNLKNPIIDVAINTTSLCEMTPSAQQMYIDTIEKTSKYFYSVNRYSSRKDKFNTIGIKELKFANKWRPLKVNFNHTYHLEFIGENLSI